MTEPASTRPTRAKRTAAQPKSAVAPIEPKSTTTRKRKRKRKDEPAEPVEPVDELQEILTDPEGVLSKVNMTNLINANTWAFLSPDSRAILSTMLPPAAFPGFKPPLSACHPARKLPSFPADRDDIDMAGAGGVELDPAFLSSTFVEAAVTTWQDNLINGYFTKAHREELEEYQRRVRDGTLHAAWKDDAWDARGAAEAAAESAPAPAKQKPKPTPRLLDLTGSGLLMAGDLLVYDRQFGNDNVQKDVLLQSIHPRTLALTIFLPKSTLRTIPHAILLYDPHAASPEAVPSTTDRNAVEDLSVSTPAQIEQAILRHAGSGVRMPRTNQTEASEKAWEAFTVWRKSDGLENLGEEQGGETERGGRKVVASLVELREMWVATQD